MGYRWFFNFSFFLSIILLSTVPSLSSDNNNDDNKFEEERVFNDFARQKRQLSKYNPATAVPSAVLVSSLMCTSSSYEEKKFCVINIKKLNYDHALIIDSADHTKFLYPDSQGTITFKQHQVIFLSCPGEDNVLKNVPGSRSFSNFTCICGASFAAYNKVYGFNDLTCKFPPKYDIIDKGFYGRESEYRKFEVGFYTDKKKSFLKIIDVHYDRSTMSTMYVKSVVSKFITGRQKIAKQYSYNQTYCCERQRNRLDMDAIYNAKTQDRSFAAQLYCHDSEFRTRCFYLNESSAVIFNRAQLSPKSSFVYTSAGSGTFVYLNTGPQWRPINEGNWARIEDHVIEMAKELRKDLVVYTGVYDRLRLKDTGDVNKEKMMFLYYVGTNNKSIAIPLYFWKLVYEPVSKKGVVYVTVNNPYVEEEENYHVCEKPMFTKDGAQMPRQWKPKNIAKGYSYMCNVSDFIRSNTITFNDFSSTMVTDLLYLKKLSTFTENNDNFTSESDN